MLLTLSILLFITIFCGTLSLYYGIASHTQENEINYNVFIIHLIIATLAWCIRDYLIYSQL